MEGGFRVYGGSSKKNRNIVGEVRGITNCVGSAKMGAYKYAQKEECIQNIGAEGTGVGETKKNKWISKNKLHPLAYFMTMLYSSELYYNGSI